MPESRPALGFFLLPGGENCRQGADVAVEAREAGDEQVAAATDHELVDPRAPDEQTGALAGGQDVFGAVGVRIPVWSMEFTSSRKL